MNKTNQVKERIDTEVDTTERTGKFDCHGRIKKHSNIGYSPNLLFKFELDSSAEKLIYDLIKKHEGSVDYLLVSIKSCLLNHFLQEPELLPEDEIVKGEDLDSELLKTIELEIEKMTAKSVLGVFYKSLTGGRDDLLRLERISNRVIDKYTETAVSASAYRFRAALARSLKRDDSEKFSIHAANLNVSMAEDCEIENRWIGAFSRYIMAVGLFEQAQEMDKVIRFRRKAITVLETLIRKDEEAGREAVSLVELRDMNKRQLAEMRDAFL